MRLHGRACHRRFASAFSGSFLSLVIEQAKLVFSALPVS